MPKAIMPHEHTLMICVEAAKVWHAKGKTEFCTRELFEATKIPRGTLAWVVAPLPRRELCRQVFYRVGDLLARGEEFSRKLEKRKG